MLWDLIQIDIALADAVLVYRGYSDAERRGIWYAYNTYGWQAFCDKLEEIDEGKIKYRLAVEE